jgi:cell wall-associated NlpC family hydrolase
MESERLTLPDMMASRLTRRRMLMRLSLFWALPAFPQLAGCARPPRSTPEDGAVLQNVFEAIQNPGSIGAAVAAAGRFFLGSPYRAHTLEVPGEEHLVVNLREFDCLTLVESCLAIARCVRRGERSMTSFRRELQHIRYRQGVLSGYASRIHYFTEWITDNMTKKIVRDLSNGIGGVPRGGPRNFMSGHRSAYRQLSEQAVFDSIKAMEKRLSAEQWYAVPRDGVEPAQEKLREGDIVGIVSSTDGLDIAHTGMVVEDGTTKRFLHASLSGDTVEVTSGSLADYVAAGRGRAGIVAARPCEPGNANDDNHSHQP